MRSHSRVVLTADRLYLVPPGAAGGDEPGPDALAIDLATVTGVRLELAANVLTVERAAAGPPVSVSFAAAETGDEVYARLWRLLGPRLELRPPGPDPRAAGGPAAVLAGVLAATLLLALAAAAGGDLTLPPALAGLDWRWVCAAGGAALALGQVWLYRRLTRPPTTLELVRR